MINAHLVEEILVHIQLVNQLAEIRFVDAVSEPTRRRQQAMQELLGQVDAVVVVVAGKPNSTRHLVQECQRAGVPALHVPGAEDLGPAWFSDCRNVGLMNGASTRNGTIHQVQQALLAMGNESQVSQSNVPQVA